MSSENHTKITERTWLPLGFVVTLIATSIGGASFVVAALNDLKSESASFKADVNYRMSRIEVQLQDAKEANWLTVDQERWSWAVRDNNRQLGTVPLWLPDPRSIKRLPEPLKE